MVRRRIPVLVVALVTLLGARVTVAAAYETAAVLRAMTCCADHCGHPAAPARAARCCQVPQGASEQWVSASPAPAAADSGCAMVLAGSPSVIPTAVHLRTATGIGPAWDPGCPVFLRTLSLRL